MSFLIFDTDILIDVLRGDIDAVNYLQAQGQQTQMAISIVTQMELVVGCRNKKELQSLRSFLNKFLLLKITESISDQGVTLLEQYRLSHGLLIADGLIAATVLEYNQPFVTKNQRDFKFIAGLNLLTYP